MELPHDNEINKLIEDSKGRASRIKTLISDLSTAQTFVQHWDNARTCNIIVNVTGHLIHVNDRMCEALGYTYDELAGSKFMDYLHQDDVAETERVFADLVIGKIPSIDRFVNRYVRRDGTAIVFMWSAFSDRNGNVVSACATIIQACVTNTALVCYCQDNNKRDCYRDSELKNNRVTEIMMDALLSRKPIKK